MKYADAVAFRRALEDRLREGAGGDGARIARNRKRVVFVRLLARLATVAPGRWALKGGFALDLRLADQARTTKDIDIAWQALAPKSSTHSSRRPVATSATTLPSISSERTICRRTTSADPSASG